MLTHPEPGSHLVGMKSYGRASSFLALTGYEQACSVGASIAGHHESAVRVGLILPETGVCGGPAPATTPASAGGCCAPAALIAPRPLRLTR